MRIALLQMCSGIDPVANAAALVDAMEQAKAAGADILFTPEMTGLIDRDRARAASNIASMEDDVVLAVARETSARLGQWVSIGSLAVAGAPAGKLSNRSVMINPMGEVIAHYDKMHLFDVVVSAQESWRESAAYAAGDSPCVVAGPGDSRIGLSICYDLRFPALYAALSRSGANILSIPAAFTIPTGEAHWHILMRARAIENACWVIAAAQCGLHEDGRSTYGHSLVIDPWGKIVLDMGDRLGLGFADVDFTAVMEARKRIPVIDHRRAIPMAECLG